MLVTGDERNLTPTLVSVPQHVTDNIPENVAVNVPENTMDAAPTYGMWLIQLVKYFL